jgi:isopentenyldiphosphate isomerase
MVDELYDYFDKNGNKIGVATWTQVHEKGLVHKNVHGIVFKDESKSQILLKKRVSGVFPDPGKIEIAVGGHILSGESPEEGLRRELKEELFAERKPNGNISIKKINYYFNNDVTNNNEIAYLFELVCDEQFYYDKNYSGKPYWIDFKFLVKDMNLNPDKYAQYSINAVKEYLRLAKC